MDEIQQRFNIEWKSKFPHVQTPMLHTVNEQEKNVDNLSDKRPREILQKLYNSTRKRTDELKSQLEHCEFIETFLQGLLTADNGGVECHLQENGTDEINVLENFAKSTVKLNKGILLESDIDDVPSANNSDNRHIQHSQDNHVLPEQKLAEPPKSDQLITQICDNRNFDKHESNDDTQQNSIQELKQQFDLVNRKCNSTHENQVTIKSDPLPRKFSEPTKTHRTRPAVPPRYWKDKSLTKHFEHGIDFAPIPSTGEPKFKSTIIVGENSTFQGKVKLKETDIDTDVSSYNDCDILNPVYDNNNTSLSPGNSEIEIHADYCQTEADEEDNMRKVGNRSSKESGGNVVVTSFRKISQENEVITSQVDTEVKNVKHDPSDHLHVVGTLSDELPGLPVRKASMDINDLENETNLQKKRQSGNGYENISLDFILTRSQRTGDSADSEDSDNEFYHNVSQFKKKDLNNGVLKSAGNISNNNLDALSISSGGDNSTSSASHSPSGRFIITQMLAILFRPFGFIAHSRKAFPIILTCQSFDF